MSGYLEAEKDLQGKVLDEFGNVKDESALNTIREILKHKESVKEKLEFLTKELLKRGEQHDNTKLMYPEILYLIAMDKEGKKEYGTPEYFEKVKRWEKFFKHHYDNNRHHPEHFKELGVGGMTLVDLAEYLCDIISYCDELHVTDAIKLLDRQQNRFGLDEQLTQILKNTLIEYFSWIGDIQPESEKT